MPTLYGSMQLLQASKPSVSFAKLAPIFSLACKIEKNLVYFNISVIFDRSSNIESNKGARNTEHHTSIFGKC